MKLEIRGLLCTGLLLISTIAWSQSDSCQVGQIGLTYGAHAESLHDRLVNDYLYKGSAWTSVSTYLSYQQRVHKLELEAQYAHTKADAQGVSEGFYEYNYSRIDLLEARLRYHYQISQILPQLKLFIMGGLKSKAIFQRQDYKSYMYDAARGWRRSFLIEPLALTAGMGLEFELGRHRLVWQGDQTLAAWTIRPDDNYVKQNGSPSSFRHQLSTISKNNFAQHHRFSYQFRYSKRWQIGLSASLGVESFYTDVLYRSVYQDYRLLITRSFSF